MADTVDTADMVGTEGTADMADMTPAMDDTAATVDTAMVDMGATVVMVDKDTNSTDIDN